MSAHSYADGYDYSDGHSLHYYSYAYTVLLRLFYACWSLERLSTDINADIYANACTNQYPDSDSHQRSIGGDTNRYTNAILF